jgi:hypothetical protein
LSVVGLTATVRCIVGKSQEGHMVGHRLCFFALAGAVAAVSAVSSSAMAANFNGSWTLVAQTTNGHCGHSYFDITISRGQVHYPGGSLMGFPAGLGGAVAASGQTRLKLVAGPRQAIGTGHLGQAQGSGTWSGTGPSGTCSGVWTATRVRAQTASVPAPAPDVSYPTPAAAQWAPPPMPMPVYQPFGASGQ